MAVKKTPTNPGFTAAFTPQAAKAIAKVKTTPAKQANPGPGFTAGFTPAADEALKATTPTSVTPDVSTGPETVTPVTPVAPDQKQKDKAPAVDSRKVLKAYLTQYKLEGLSEQTYNMLAENQITAETPIDVIGELLKDTDVYKTRFSGNVAREAAKQSTYSISEYLQLEDRYKDAMQGSGLPSTFYDSPDDYAKFIGGDVSVAEVQRRVDEGFKAVNDANPEVVKQLKSLYNVGDGGIAAYFLDPTKATDMLVKQAAAAGRSAQAQLQAGMQLTSTQAEGLVADNVSTADAKQGFTTIGQSQGLYSNLIGETGAITQEEQIAGTFGTNQAAAQRIAQRKRQRQAEFTTGGTFTTTQGGVSGLGSANK